MTNMHDHFFVLLIIFNRFVISDTFLMVNFDRLLHDKNRYLLFDLSVACKSKRVIHVSP